MQFKEGNSSHRFRTKASTVPTMGVSFGRDWGSAQGAAGIDAPCQYPNDDEHLRESHGEEQT